MAARSPRPARTARTARTARAIGPTRTTATRRHSAAPATAVAAAASSVTTTSSVTTNSVVTVWALWGRMARWRASFRDARGLIGTAATVGAGAVPTAAVAATVGTLRVTSRRCAMAPPRRTAARIAIRGGTSATAHVGGGTEGSAVTDATHRAAIADPVADIWVTAAAADRAERAAVADGVAESATAITRWTLWLGPEAVVSPARRVVPAGCRPVGSACGLIWPREVFATHASSLWLSMTVR
jgi:hypothetical protein